MNEEVAVKYLDIAQVSPFYDEYPSGSGNFTRELVEQILNNSNHNVSVYTSKINRKHPRFEQRGRLKIYRGPTLGVVWNVNPATLIFHRLLKDSYDLLHVHSYVYFSSNQAWLIKKIRKKPLILHLHGGLDTQAMRKYASNLQIIFKETVYDKTFGKFLVESADVILSSSKKDIELLRKKWYVPKEKIIWIPNAVDINRFSSVKNSKQTNNSKNTLLFVGKLEPWKGLQVLIEALKEIQRQVSDIRLLVAGSGSQLKYLSSYVGDLPIQYLGYVPNDSIPLFLSQASLVVIPSLMEGLPLVCLESLACGVPVVASDTGDLREIIHNGSEDGKAGVTVKPGDPNDLAEAVIKLLQDEQMRLKMANNGRKIILEKYNWPVVIKKILQIYESILN